MKCYGGLIASRGGYEFTQPARRYVMLNKTTRREMLRNTTLAGFGVWVAGQSASAIAQSPNEKLNVASIGVGGR